MHDVILPIIQLDVLDTVWRNWPDDFNQSLDYNILRRDFKAILIGSEKTGVKVA